MPRRMPALAVALAAILAAGGPAAAQNEAGLSDAWLDPNLTAASEPSAEPSAPASEPVVAMAPAGPRLVPWVDYSGGLESRAALTGDWKGIRQSMMNDGVRMNLNLTQTLQGNVAGGLAHRLFYQGGMRYEVELDTEAMRMWPGGMVHVRGETQYGETDLFDSGAILPVNTDALYPVPVEEITCLSEAYYTQFFTPWLGARAGKISPRSRNVFAHDETTQFFNTAFNFNPVYGLDVPLDFLAAGVVVQPCEWFNVTTYVLDAEGTANTSGFDTAFEAGTTVFQIVEFAIEPFELPGHQRAFWTWSDKSFVVLTQIPQDILPQLILTRTPVEPPPGLQTRNSDWSILYDFDQYLYVKPDTKDEGVGLFGRFGLSDGVVNPFQTFYSLGTGGKGIIPGRNNDTFGVGYYFLALSNELGPVISQPLGDEQGVEVWYNIAITPWWHLTPDIQVIDPGRKVSDTAVVLGLRMRIDF